MRYFYTSLELSDIIKISDFSDTVVPIVWGRNGEFRVVPVVVIKNTNDTLLMQKQVTGKTTQPEAVIHWCQGIPISNLAGRALVGE